MRKEPVTKLDLNFRLIKTNYEVEDLLNIWYCLSGENKMNILSIRENPTHVNEVIAYLFS